MKSRIYFCAGVYSAELREVVHVDLVFPVYYRIIMTIVWT